MPETENREPIQEVKEMTTENLLNAKNPAEVVKAYLAIEKTTQPRDLSRLQLAVAERFSRLDDPDNAIKFTLLAGNSRNAEAERKSNEILLENLPGEIKRAIESGSEPVLEAIESLKKLPESLMSPVGEFKTATSTIETASKLVEQSTKTFETQVGTFDRAVRKMPR